MDVKHLAVIRENVSAFIKSCSEKFDKLGSMLLDIAPQDHAGAKAFFTKAEIRTLDIDPASGADYIADICKKNDDKIESDLFDLIICTEVLEHTLNPFKATEELNRILKPGGKICVSVPFNFRIHGPLPDCWRFTIHGLRALFGDYTDVEINELATPGRDLMPVHYTLTATKK